MDIKTEILRKFRKQDLNFRIDLIDRLNAGRRKSGLPENHGLDVNRDNQKEPIYITAQELIDELARRGTEDDSRKNHPAALDELS